MGAAKSCWAPYEKGGRPQQQSIAILEVSIAILDVSIAMVKKVNPGYIAHTSFDLRAANISAVLGRLEMANQNRLTKY